MLIFLLILAVSMFLFKNVIEEDGTYGIVVGFIITPIIYLILFLMPYNIYLKNITKYDVVTSFKNNIYSLKSDKNISGNFILGSGAIDEVDYYYFYKHSNRGYYKLKVRANKSFIIEDAVFENAYIMVYNIYKGAPVSNWIMLNINNWGILNQEYEFHIPPNSIIRSFNVN